MQLNSELSLLLAIISSASMAIILKLFQSGNGNRYAIILGNYLTCILIAFLLLPDKSAILHTQKPTLVCGCIGGVLFVAGLVGVQSSIQRNGAILTSAFSRLGLLVPLLMSILFLGEKPGILQLAGILLVLAAMLLISGKADTKRTAAPLLLIAVLLACGSADAMAKLFEQIGAREQDLLYFLYVFLTAGILTLLLLIHESVKNRTKVLPLNLLAGIVVGIPNYFSSMLLLKALIRLPAFIVYPSFSTGSILLVTMVSVLLFRERPGRRQWIGLAMILAALVLLNMPS